MQKKQRGRQSKLIIHCGPRRACAPVSALILSFFLALGSIRTRLIVSLGRRGSHYVENGQDLFSSAFGECDVWWRGPRIIEGGRGHLNISLLLFSQRILTWTARWMRKSKERLRCPLIWLYEAHVKRTEAVCARTLFTQGARGHLVLAMPLTSPLNSSLLL